MKALRMYLSRHRRIVAALVAFIAVLLGLSALRPASAPATTLIVAATDIPAGSTLQASDLAMAEIPLEYAAPGAIPTLADALGRTVSTALSAGEVVTRTRLAAEPLSSDGGTLVAPVRLADAEVAALLTPGMRVDIVRASRTGEADVLAEAVRVITVPRHLGFGPSADRSSGSLVLVAADRATAIRLASASTQGGLSAILR
ncbi:MAG: SAF domain-containing protein [Candidatus Nanopelagicales bacterium]